MPGRRRRRFISDGDNTYGGKVVTNPSGGLLSKGHPLGATGLAQCYELTHQLRGTAAATQVEGARLALQHNLGLGGACVVTLYERALRLRTWSINPPSGVAAPSPRRRARASALFFETLEEANPVYRDADAARDAGLCGPAGAADLPVLSGNDGCDVPFEMLTELDIDLARILHGEQSFVYHAPVVVGDTLTFKSRVASVTDKKGGAMTLIVVETPVTNQNGIHVADISRTIVVRNGRAS